MKRLRLATGGVVAAVVSVLAGCTVGGGEGKGEAACANVVVYEGRWYFGYNAGDVEAGERLGTAIQPACDDTGGYPDDGPGEPERRVTAYAIKGVDPAVAIMVDPESPEPVMVVDRKGEALPPEVRELLRGTG